VVGGIAVMVLTRRPAGAAEGGTGRWCPVLLLASLYPVFMDA